MQSCSAGLSRTNWSDNVVYTTTQFNSFRFHRRLQPLLFAYSTAARAGIGTNGDALRIWNISHRKNYSRLSFFHRTYLIPFETNWAKLRPSDSISLLSLYICLCRSISLFLSCSPLFSLSPTLTQTMTDTDLNNPPTGPTTSCHRVGETDPDSAENLPQLLELNWNRSGNVNRILVWSTLLHQIIHTNSSFPAGVIVCVIASTSRSVLSPTDNFCLNCYM